MCYIAVIVYTTSYEVYQTDITLSVRPIAMITVVAEYTIRFVQYTLYKTYYTAFPAIKLYLKQAALSVTFNT